MEIIKTNHPVFVDGQAFSAPTGIIFQHILDNEEMYADIDVSILDFGIGRLMAKCGSSYSQAIQNAINEAKDGVHNPVFIINFDKLDEFYDFGDSLVFTPESSYSRKNFLGIPRTTVAVDNGDVIEKDVLFSFKGADWTHPIRKRLIDMFPNECVGYKGWGVDNNDSDFRNDYISLIKKSKFSLCPRGYGRTSYRLYESMMCGTIPVIISDDWEPPLAYLFDWNQFSITVKEAEINRIPEILSSFSDDDIIRMSNKAKGVFNEYFNKDNMYKCVYLYLKERSNS